MSVKLTILQQQYLARRGSWYFDCYFGKDQSDSSVYAGDGVDDLDSLIGKLDFANKHNGVGPKARFLADVGTQYSDWRAFDIDDLRAIRGYYVQIYGATAKPPVVELSTPPDGAKAIPVYA